MSAWQFLFWSLCLYIGEGNGNPLQCFCLENPRDRGAWCAAVYGVAQSRTRLKRLSSSRSRLLVDGFQESYFKFDYLCNLRGRGKREEKIQGERDTALLGTSLGAQETTTPASASGGHVPDMCQQTAASTTSVRQDLGPQQSTSPSALAAATGPHYRHSRPCCALSACCRRSKSCQNGSHRDFQSSDELQVRREKMQRVMCESALWTRWEKTQHPL